MTSLNGSTKTLSCGYYTREQKDWLILSFELNFKLKLNKIEKKKIDYFENSNFFLKNIMLIKLNRIKKILKEFNLEKIKKIKPLATSGNITHIIETDKKNYLLRLCLLGPRWRSKQEIEAELELVNYLLKKKFPLSKPITVKDGRQVVSFKKHFGYLREFVNGKTKLNPGIKEVEPIW